MVAKRRFRDGCAAAPVEEYTNTAPGSDNDAKSTAGATYSLAQIRRIDSVLQDASSALQRAEFWAGRQRQAPGLDKGRPST